MAVKNCFIRGSVVRYVQLPAEHVDTQLLEDATRRGGHARFCIPTVSHAFDRCLLRGRQPSEAVTSVKSSVGAGGPRPQWLLCRNLVDLGKQNLLCASVGANHRSTVHHGTTARVFMTFP